jgi:hypothetical protein
MVNYEVIEKLKKIALERCAEMKRAAEENGKPIKISNEENGNHFQKCLFDQYDCGNCDFTLKKEDCRSPLSVYNLVTRQMNGLKKV